MQAVATDFDALSDSDFDWNNADANGWERLAELCDEMAQLDDVAQCAPTMFRLIERLNESDLGSPGPLVHTLEKWSPGYEPFLVDSIRRKPCSLTVWMVNRILNSAPENPAQWLGILRVAANSPDATTLAKAEAKEFIEHQQSK